MAADASHGREKFKFHRITPLTLRSSALSLLPSFSHYFEAIFFPLCMPDGAFLLVLALLQHTATTKHGTASRREDVWLKKIGLHECLRLSSGWGRRKGTKKRKLFPKYPSSSSSVPEKSEIHLPPAIFDRLYSWCHFLLPISRLKHSSIHSILSCYLIESLGVVMLLRTKPHTVSNYDNWRDLGELGWWHLWLWRYTLEFWGLRRQLEGLRWVLMGFCGRF